VTGWLELAGILDRSHLPKDSRAEVLNGIAYEPKSKRLFVTGKYWPTLFEIELTEKP
jgi:glutamine cyclotransferase